jgi:hypothetical protein
MLFLHFPDEGAVTAELGRNSMKEINSVAVCEMPCESSVGIGKAKIPEEAVHSSQIRDQRITCYEIEAC